MLTQTQTLQQKRAQTKLLVFDVFGSVVDWRTSVMRDLSAWAKPQGLDVDWNTFAVAWRQRYQPQMEEVRNGNRSWAILDTLHRESLEMLLEQFHITGLTEQQKDHINRVWHRLDAWPDAIASLWKLKAHYTIAPLSNGNVALLTNMAKHAGLPWDLVLSTEWFKAYKPQPQTYLGVAQTMGLEPHEVMLCAAHNADLSAAKACGLGTAFWPRPTEYAHDQTQDLVAQDQWDVIAYDMRDLARQLCD